MTIREQMPRLHAVSDVAEMFGRAPRTIRSWIARGLLTPIKVGNAVFIPQDQIDALLMQAPAAEDRASGVCGVHSNINDHGRHSKSILQ